MPGSFIRFETRRTNKGRICSRCSVVIRKHQLYCRFAQRKGKEFKAFDLCCRCGSEKAAEEEESKHVSKTACVMF